MIIIGIDIAKRTHEACMMNQSGNLLGKPFSFPNSHAGVELLLKQVRKTTLSYCPSCSAWKLPVITGCPFIPD